MRLRLFTQRQLSKGCQQDFVFHEATVTSSGAAGAAGGRQSPPRDTSRHGHPQPAGINDPGEKEGKKNAFFSEHVVGAQAVQRFCECTCIGKKIKKSACFLKSNICTSISLFPCKEIHGIKVIPKQLNT